MKKNILKLCVIVAICFPAMAKETVDGSASNLRPMDNPIYVGAKQGQHWCGTQAAWDLKKERIHDLNKAAAGCPLEGACDSVAVRDATQIEDLNIGIIVHVIRNGDGSGGISEQTVFDSIDQLNVDYGNAGLTFSLAAIRYHNDSKLACISAYSYSGKYAQDIASIKNKYAESTDTHINVYVSCQDSGRLGTLLGIATFPWDPDALATQGGLWMNNIAMGDGAHTLSHEMGHCLGLWHTHHGVSEVTSCGDCYEFASGFEGDIRGDFASDTPPTPTNYNCTGPGGSDCQGTNWGATNPENIMGYGPDTCLNMFSPQQGLRLQCWVKDALVGWLGSGSGLNLPPSAAFSFSTNVLTMDVDGSASSDSDGSIASYAWNFGDSNSAAGVTASHTFSASGSYTVSLTVTDNEGATNTTSQSVVVSDGTGDVTPPVISNVSSKKKGRKFTISWNTDELSDSAVVFPVHGTFPDATMVTSHSMTFTGSNGVSYEYYVASTDATGNTATSGPYTHNN